MVCFLGLGPGCGGACLISRMVSMADTLFTERVRDSEQGRLLRSARLRIPDLEIVEEAALTHAAELDLGLGRMCDAGGLEEGDGFAVDGGAHGVAHGFEHGFGKAELCTHCVHNSACCMRKRPLCSH